MGGGKTEVGQVLLPYIIMLLYAHSAVQPLLFILIKSEVRQSLVAMFTGQKSKPKLDNHVELNDFTDLPDHRATGTEH